MKKKILLTLILAIFIFNILGLNIAAIAADTETEDNTNLENETEQLLKDGLDISEEKDGSIKARIENSTLVIEGRGNLPGSFDDILIHDSTNFKIIQESFSRYVKENQKTYELLSSIKKIEVKNGIDNFNALAILGLYGTNVEELVISESVEDISYETLSVFENLKKIEVDDKNNYYCSIDGVLYNKEKTEIIWYPMAKEEENYNIADSVINISDFAFWGCNNLKKVNMPNHLKTIGQAAFYECYGLEEVIMPEEVISIGDEAFAGCYNLRKINIPSKLTEVGNDVFLGCSGFEEINIPEPENISGKVLWKLFISNIGYDEAIDIKRSVLPVILNIKTSNKYIETSKIYTLYRIIGDPLTNNPQFYNCEISEDEKRINLISDDEVGIISVGTCIIRIVKTEDITYNYIQDKSEIYYEKLLTSGAKNFIGYPRKWKMPLDDLAKIDDYYNNEWVSSVEAVLYLNEGDVVLNNNGSNRYIFTENGEFTFKYRTKDGQEKTKTAKVTNIDNKAPKVMNVSKEETDSASIEIKVEAEDDQSGINGYIFKWTEQERIEQNREFKENTCILPKEQKRIEIYVEDNVLNLARRTIDVETCAIIGDVNEDGDIDFKDILDINKHRLSEPTLKGKNLVSADVNSDGKADFKDMLLINKFRLGKIENF